MTKRTGPTNTHLRNLIFELRKQSALQKVALWSRIADDLEKPTRQRREVNIYKINKCTKDGEIVIVPGKVLGTGDLDHKITVAAFRFSESAVQKIKNKAKILTIQELMKSNPKASNVKILG